MCGYKYEIRKFSDPTTLSFDTVYDEVRSKNIDFMKFLFVHLVQTSTDTKK